MMTGMRFAVREVIISIGILKKRELLQSSIQIRIFREGHLTVLNVSLDYNFVKYMIKRLRNADHE